MNLYMPKQNTANRALRAALFMDKGGVTKTTSTAHLGEALAREYGLNVLLIDLAGKQGDLSKQFGIHDEVRAAEDDAWPNISTVFAEEWSTIAEKVPDAVEDMIWETGENVDLIPAHEGLDSVDDDLASVNVEDRYTRLDEFLTNYVDPLGYDVVLLDLPGLTNNVTLNGLFATGRVIAPLTMGEFEERQLDQLVADIDEIVAGFDVDLELAMVLPSMYDKRANVDTEMLARLREQYPDRIAPSPITDSQGVPNAQAEGRTVFAVPNDELLATAKRVKDAYTDAATALLQRVDGETATTSTETN